MTKVGLQSVIIGNYSYYDICLSLKNVTIVAFRNALSRMKWLIAMRSNEKKSHDETLLDKPDNYRESL